MTTNKYLILYIVTNQDQDQSEGRQKGVGDLCLLPPVIRICNERNTT